MKVADIEHPAQPDPVKRKHPEQFQPEVALGQDGAAVVAARVEGRELRRLAKLAGGPVEELKEY